MGQQHILRGLILGLARATAEIAMEWMGLEHTTYRKRTRTRSKHAMAHGTKAKPIDEVMCALSEHLSLLRQLGGASSLMAPFQPATDESTWELLEETETCTSKALLSRRSPAKILN